MDSDARRLREGSLTRAFTILEDAPGAVFVGALASWRGEYRDALAIIRPAFAALRDDDELFSLALAYSQLTIVLGGAGEYAQALELIAKGIGLAESIGDRCGAPACGIRAAGS
jgi:tetratricopeptide (TPR) repeat protein